jgi:cytochrome P450
MSQRLPPPPEAGFLNALRFGTETFRFLEGIQARFEDGTSIPVPGKGSLVLLTNPDLARDALERPEDFPRVEALDSAAMIAENGLVQSEGALWRQQRSIMGPAFGGQQVNAYADTTGERAEALAERWAEAGPQELNLHRAATSLTVRVASEILLGTDIGKEWADTFHEWMRAAGEEFEFGPEVAMPDWVPTRTSPEFREAADGIRGLAEDLIERRRADLAAGDGGMDMLTLLLQAEDDPDVDYPENQIRDEVSTFLIAGHETTALSLTYTLALLSWNPETRQRVREEAEAALGDQEGPPSHEDLSNLEYTKRAYREALRLYPPAWAVFRRTEEPVDLGDYRIEGDSGVIVPLWSIHRDDRYFDEPERFDPDRWERRNPNEVDAYFPFSTGPHACIGQGFALAGATLTLARLVRDFDIDIAENELDSLRVTPTLRPTDGVAATVRPID